MDNETIKELILEKIFDELAPKIIGCYKFISYERDFWCPNVFYLKKCFQEPVDGIQIFLTISIDEKGNFKNCSLQKTRQRLNVLNRVVDDLNNIEHEYLNVIFDNKKTAIKEICKLLGIQEVIKIGICAIKEIESHEDCENISIGSIKKILGFNIDTDLRNLETRKILTEFIR